MNTVITRTPAALAIDASIERAKTLIEEYAIPPNTKRAYLSDFAHFEEWCHTRGLQSFPAAPGTMVLYLTDLSERYKLATIERRRAAVVQVHKAGNQPPPLDGQVSLTMKAIRHKLSRRQSQKAPATIDHIARMVTTCDTTAPGIRDRALLLVGFAGAFRRAELVALNVEDIALVPEGLAVTIRRCKTDQTGEGEKIGIPYGKNKHTCPVRSLKAWLTEAGITAGPVFRGIDRHGNVQPRRLTPQSVALVVKRAAAASGLDESLFGGHSLRAGLATSAAAAGVEERLIANQTRHKSMTVLRRYIRDGSLFRGNAAGKVGL